MSPMGPMPDALDGDGAARRRGGNMNAARDLLDDLAMIGATVEPAGDRLILRAGPIAIPAALVNRVREAKADLIATLAVCTDHTVLGARR